ncbi:MAG: hypothetical protein RBR50_04345 [Candidatus Izemoplasmatales bacterium]|nr:hypothetical protein [Candidatus Izemoplasmatales bacterium]
MKKRFTLSLISLVAAAFLFVGTSFAWFVINQQTPIDTLGGSVSGIVYNIDGDFIEDNYLYPDEEAILNPFTIVNQSKDSLYLRVKVEYTNIDRSYNSNTETYEFTVPSQRAYTNVPSLEDIDVTFNNPALFTYDSGDSYWYYAQDLQQGVSHQLIDSIYYDGFKVSNEYSNVDITLSITLEVKTLDGVWSTLTTLLFQAMM